MISARLWRALLALAGLVTLLSCAVPSREEYAIVTTSRGELVFRLTPELSPQAVDHFKALVRNRTYDDTRVYRVVSGYFAQGGIGYDEAMHEKPIGKDGGGRGNNVRGALSLAWQDLNDPGSATTEFYWCTADLSELDRQGFVTIAHLVSGFETLDAIDQSQTTERYRHWDGQTWREEPSDETIAIAWHAPEPEIKIHSIRLR